MTTTTYFASGEDTGFTFTGSTVTMQTTTNTFRSGWARGALEVSAGSTTDPPSPRMTGRNFVDSGNSAIAVSAGWVHFWGIWGASGGACTNNATLFRLLDSSAVARLMVRGAGSGALKISKRDASGSFTDLATTPNSSLPLGGLDQNVIDFEFNYGEVITYSRSDLSFSGGVLSTTAGDFVAAGFTDNGTVVVSNSASNNGTYEFATVATNSMTLGTGSFVTESDTDDITLTATGTARLYINAATSPNAYIAGGISTNSVTTLAQLDLANCDTAQPIFLSEVIVSSGNTIGKGLWTLSLTAAGATQAWTPNTLTNINKAVINDTTFISTGGTNEISEWLTNQSIPAGGWLVDAVIEEARLEVGASGPQHAEWLVDTNGSIATAGTISPSTSFGNFAWIWDSNPITTQSWVVSDIVPVSGTFDIGVESLA